MMKGSRLVKSQFCNGNNVVAKRKHDVMQCSLHGHDFYELDIVLGGCAKAVLNGRSLVAKAGTVFFLSPEDFHEYPTDSPLEIYNIQFTNEAVSVDLLRRVMDSRNRIYTLSEDSFEGVRRLCAMIQELSVGAELFSHLLEGILLFLCCNQRTESHLPEQSGYETQSHFNREFREYYHITPMSLRKEKNEGDYNEREDRTW